jgi:hypothetical protein
MTDSIVVDVSDVFQEGDLGGVPVTSEANAFR